jgi:hypothetical protein
MIDTCLSVTPHPSTHRVKGQSLSEGVFGKEGVQFFVPQGHESAWEQATLRARWNISANSLRMSWAMHLFGVLCSSSITVSQVMLFFQYSAAMLSTGEGSPTV